MAGNRYIADLEPIPTIGIEDCIPIQKGQGGPNTTYKVPFSNVLSHLESGFASNVKKVIEKHESFTVDTSHCGTIFIIDSQSGVGSPSIGLSQVFVNISENLPIGFHFSCVVLQNEYVYFNPPFTEQIRDLNTNITAGIPFTKFDEVRFTKITNSIWNYVTLNEYNPVELQIDYTYYQTASDSDFITNNDLYLIVSDAD